MFATIKLRHHPMLKSDLPTIQGNRRQLREVILNLVQNSIEAMTGSRDEGSLAS